MSYIQFGDTIMYPIHALDSKEDTTLYPCVINIDHKYSDPSTERERCLNDSLSNVSITKIDEDMNTIFKTRERPYLQDVITLIRESNPGRYIQKWDYDNGCLIFEPY